ncbi:hypothetical protein GCM10020219_017790 [Nonomuraea dietziae]
MGDLDDAEPLTAAVKRDEAITDLAESRSSARCSSRRGVLGLVLDCPECSEQHFFDWELLRGTSAR